MLFRSKALVIVESPSKAKTIQKYLGRDYIVKASVGHIKDLPKSKLGVDVKKGFEPDYQVIPAKTKVIEELKKAIHAVLPDRTEKVFSSLTELRDICGVPIATIIRACKSGKPVRSGTVAGWVLSYQGAEINTAPEIPAEYLEYPRTRKLAMDAGVKFYFTGIPCERGHTALRLVKGTCELCRKENWKKENDRRKHKPK